MQYSGVATPFKGTRVYARAAMGMPGSTEWLDELTSRVLGELIQEGVAEKIADDLYVGGKGPAQLLHNWRRVLELFRKNNLRLKASKTVVALKHATVLGWVWNNGSISVSPHRVNALMNCDPPSTVTGLRSWIGAYKHLKCCVSQYSALLSPLERLQGGKDSRHRLDWRLENLQYFRAAQNGLRNLKPVTIPRPTDHTIVTADGSIKNQGIGSVMYILRNGQILLGGCLNLSDCQVRWLPCELEALAIASSVDHWQLYIRESTNVVQILTDSKPCVQAAKKLARGEFSASARISTFLTTLSRYFNRINLQHISGTSTKLLPADYLSRHPSECPDHDCQVCVFAQECADSVVQSVSVSDVLNQKCGMPFSNKAAWLESQNECIDLRRVRAHLAQGNQP